MHSPSPGRLMLIRESDWVRIELVNPFHFQEIETRVVTAVRRPARRDLLESERNRNYSDESAIGEISTRARPFKHHTKRCRRSTCRGSPSQIERPAAAPHYEERYD